MLAEEYCKEERKITQYASSLTVTIPMVFWKVLGWKKGDTLECELLDDGSIVYRKKKESEE